MPGPHPTWRPPAIERELVARHCVPAYVELKSLVYERPEAFAHPKRAAGTETAALQSFLFHGLGALYSLGYADRAIDSLDANRAVAPDWEIQLTHRLMILAACVSLAAALDQAAKQVWMRDGSVGKGRVGLAQLLPDRANGEICAKLDVKNAWTEDRSEALLEELRQYRNLLVHRLPAAVLFIQPQRHAYLFAVDRLEDTSWLYHNTGYAPDTMEEDKDTPKELLDALRKPVKQVPDQLADYRAAADRALQDIWADLYAHCDDVLERYEAGRP